MLESLIYCKPKITRDKKPKPHQIFLNEQVNLSIAKEGITIGIFGQSGSGKTYTSLLIGSQTNCIFFDPQARAKKILKEMDEDDNWKIFYITQEPSRKNIFKINANVLHTRVTNILAKTTRPKDRSAMMVLSKFCSLTKSAKTYNHLKKMFEDKSLYDYWDDIKIILDENDDGIDLEKIQSGGRYVIDVSEITAQSKSIGILTETIVGMRASKKWKETPLLIGYDESQVNLKKDTFIGMAFELLSTRARTYGVSTLVSGVYVGPIYKGIKSNIKVLIIHKVVYDREDYLAFGIDIDEEKISLLPSSTGYCYYYYPDKNISSGIMIRPDTYFQEIRDEEVNVIKYRKIDFKNF